MNMKLKQIVIMAAAIAMGVCSTTWIACVSKCVPTADTVVYGTIRTAETEKPVAEALAIKDGKFVYVGDKAGRGQVRRFG